MAASTSGEPSKRCFCSNKWEEFARRKDPPNMQQEEYWLPQSLPLGSPSPPCRWRVSRSRCFAPSHMCGAGAKGQRCSTATLPPLLPGALGWQSQWGPGCQVGAGPPWLWCWNHHCRPQPAAGCASGGMAGGTHHGPRSAIMEDG